jgi:hypothetical protein
VCNTVHWIPEGFGCSWKKIGVLLLDISNIPET